MNLIIVMVALGLWHPTPALAAELAQMHLEYSTSTAELIVRAYGLKWGVSGAEMWQTTLCENRSLDPLKQSEIIDKSGAREDSWGNSQINLYWHPEVTREQAQDPFFAADFMGRYFAAGKQSQWTCWRKLYGVHNSLAVFRKAAL
ncbi:hypothetical protein KW797_04280 [Candidatus Parcubacteria bacterium]|nr:hypothetical protein [Candidatus Parcubacteria bacterium]